MANPMYNEHCPAILTNNLVFFLLITEPCKWLVLVASGLLLRDTSPRPRWGNWWGSGAGELRCSL